MKYETIDEIYAGNEKVRARLKDVVGSLPDERATALPEGEKWTVAQIVEHISMVDEGAMRICARLLRKAQEAGRTHDGKVVITEDFLQKGSEIAGIKVQAPDIVQPTGTKSISDSLAKLDENSEQLEKLRELFKSVDGTELKFPHPFFGDISAQEWLSLKGGHEMRHIKQIEKVLAKIK
jgi:hypothetical protein